MLLQSRTVDKANAAHLKLEKSQKSSFLSFVKHHCWHATQVAGFGVSFSAKVTGKLQDETNGVEKW
jgi:hypothetical protein